jgi:tetratricopeptide (TPR) repeat protein
VRIVKRDSFGALSDLDKAIEIDPKSARYFESRANVHTLRDNPQATAEDLGRAIALEPGRTDLRLRRARTLVALDHHAEAVGELDAIIAKSPTAEAHFLRGTSLLEQKKLQGAIIDFSETLKREPTHERALLQRGLARAMVDDRKEAIADLEQFLVVSPASKHRPLAEKWLARLRK